MGIDPAFWHGRRVLLTGHTGFKGSWLALWLCRLGAEVHGVALAPDSLPALFEQLELSKQLARSSIRRASRHRETARVSRAALWRVWAAAQAHASPRHPQR